MRLEFGRRNNSNSIHTDIPLFGVKIGPNNAFLKISTLCLTFE